MFFFQKFSKMKPLVRALSEAEGAIGICAQILLSLKNAANSNAFLLAKFGFDAAEIERPKN